jgi:hypothetical protein
MMPERQDIDYELLVDRAIDDFHPVKRLWAVSTRLAFWILLETALLILCAGIKVINDLSSPVSPRDLVECGPLILTSIAAAFLAMRSAIPGREVARWELLLLMAAVVKAVALNYEPSARSVSSDELVHAGGISTLKLLGLSALPWIVLFWSVRRGVPMQPAKTGALVGIVAFCLALAMYRFTSQASVFPNPIILQVLFGILVTAISAPTGSIWLNWISRWQQTSGAAIAPTLRWTLFNAGTAFPLAIRLSIVALMLVIGARPGTFASVPDFDLAIDHYNQSLTGFSPNVPSSSVETVLNAYAEHGMPVYMWDFGAEGFKLVGGRWEPLSDGTPVTYTWFRNGTGGVICMFKHTEGFERPSATHEEHGHLLFYKYRGFSVCLINVGGYGNFIRVIAAPMPMKRFVPMVFTATAP